MCPYHEVYTTSLLLLLSNAGSQTPNAYFHHRKMFRFKIQFNNNNNTNVIRQVHKCSLIDANHRPIEIVFF